MEFIRTNALHKGFIELVALLDAELVIRDGDDHAFYNQFNKLDDIKEVILVLEDEKPIACGAIKRYDSSSTEIKRMFVHSSKRGEGIASEILLGLEKWAVELGYKRCILETGFKQPEAIALYQKLGFQRMENYGQYKGIENSLCFEKILGG